MKRRAAMVVSLVLAAATSAMALSSTEESAMGRRFDLEARTKLQLIDDPAVEGYLNGIGTRIAGNLDDHIFDYNFTALRDGRVNAFAVPGGFVYVNAGLLVRAANDDEVAGVLGHEIAHVQAHHLARQEDSTKLLNYAALAGMILAAIQPAIGAGAVAASAATQLKYQREFEQEADYLGARYMRAGGYDPRGMLDFFKKLSDEQRSNPSLMPPYLLSHPLTQERLINLEAVLRQRQWDKGERHPISLGLDRAKLVARMALEPMPQVVGDYRQRAEANPRDARSQYLFGLALLQSGDAGNATAQLERAVALGFASADRDLGRSALVQRKPEDARDHLIRATEKEPDDPVAFRELGRALEAAGDNEGGLRAYRRAAELAPRCEDVQYSLGMLAGRSGHAAEGYFHIAQATLLKGDYRQAIEQFHKVELAPGADDKIREDARVAIRDLSLQLGLKEK